MSIGRIVVDLLARTGSFETDLARASKQAERRAREIDAAFVKAGKAIGGMAVAAGGAIALSIRQTASLANEFTNLAQVSGAGVVEFQKYAAGAAQVGINQEKLADQLKDFREKTGEFLATGGGAMKDFFEQVAPRIGLTAEAFRDVSGPQGLQLYYDSLEKAGLSQEKMSFYLESMASDTTALIPLLRDSGAGFKKAADDAERMGTIIGEQTVKAAAQLSKDVDLLTRSMQGAISNGLGPMIKDLAVLTGSFVQARTEGRNLWKSLTAGTQLQEARAEMAKLYQERERLAEQQEKLTRQIGDDEHLQAGLAGDSLRAVEQRMEAVRARLMELGDIVKELQIVEQAKPPALPLEPPKGNGSGGGGGKSGKGVRDQVAEMLQGIQDDIARFNMSDLELAVFDAKKLGASDAQLKEVEALAGKLYGLKQAWEESETAARAAADTKAEIARVFEETRTPAEALANELDHLNKLLAAGMDLDTYSRAEFAAWDRFDELTKEAKEATKEIDNFAKHAAENIQDVIADTLVSSTDSSFREISANFARMIQKMLADAVAADLTRSLFGNLVEGGSGKGLFGNLLSSIAGAFGGSIGSPAPISESVPVFVRRAAGGPVAAGSLYEVGELDRPELFSAGGRQFLIPGNAGRISPITSGVRLPEQAASRPDGKMSLTIVNNTSSKIGRVTEQRISDTERALIIEEAVDAAWAQPNDPNSRASRVLSRNFNVRRSR